MEPCREGTWSAALAAPEPEEGALRDCGGKEEKEGLSLHPRPTTSDRVGPIPAGLRPKAGESAESVCVCVCVCVCGMGCVHAGVREREVGWKMPVIICVFVLYP